jgi:hypothetical protein
MVATLILGIVVTLAFRFLINTQVSLSRVQFTTGLTNTALVVQHDIAVETRSGSIVVPLPSGCSTACTGLSTVTLLTQSGVSTQTCWAWKVVAGSAPTLQSASWAPGSTQPPFSILAYLQTAGTFTVTSTAGLPLLSYAFSVVSPPRPIPPWGITAFPITDSVAARNPSPSVSPC